MYGDGVALLSHEGDMSSFAYGDDVLRFRTSPHLVRYHDTVEWDNGYLVVNAEYDTLGIVEEYIDITTVLKHLMRDAAEFLAPVKKVVVSYA